MRQTSRAVALLLALESANAAVTTQVPAGLGKGGDYVTIFNPSDSPTGSSPTNSQQLSNRTAGYTGLTQVFAQSSVPTAAGSANTVVTGWTDATYSGGKVNDAATAQTIAAQPRGTAIGSGCVQCIRGTGVWCSRSYAYLSTNNVFQAATSTAATNATILPATAAAVYGGASFDGGFCCDSKDNFNLFVGTKTALVQTRAVNNNATSAGAAGTPMVQNACPAIMQESFVDGTAGASSQAFGVSQIDNANTQYSSWWCSNGLYKKVTVAATTVIVNAQQTIHSSENQRLELALVGCPQGTTMCANGATMAYQLVAGTPKVYSMPAAGDMSMLNKCTWVAWSTDAGPTFTFTNGPALGLVGSNWEIHAMEYTAQGTSFDGSKGSLVPSAEGGLILANEGLAAGNYTPLFTMPADQFATLRTWYGEGSLVIDPVTQQTSTWSSAGGAPIANSTAASLQLAGVKSQLYGNVANVPVSTAAASTTSAVLTATQNYGTYNSIRFDLRQMRFFPAKVAQTQHAAGTTAAATYTSALTSYNTAKTTWDAYVAILEKNAKQDAFAALFSPPKAPTVPPLPNKPWLPAAYSGYTRATAQQVTGFTNAATASTSAAPLASEIWTSLAAAQTVGGWGSFTAHILRFRNGWGKSFGTIGYDGTGTAMSDVWNYKWQCGAVGGSGALANSVYPGVNTVNQCAPVYSGTAGVALQPATAATPINAVKMITVVSLWSTFMVAASTTNTVWATNGFGITFTSGTWTSGVVGLTPIAAPTAAVAAKSLTGIAGAQALVASSAAALAVAAALY